MTDSPIAAMFDRISPHYDHLNHLLSFNIDKVWRRKTVREVSKQNPKLILDLATGTADLAIALAKHNPRALITGVDFSEKMLKVGKEKVKQQHLENQIVLLQGDVAHLSFPDHSFDAVSVAFGVRNFENLKKGLSEICRVTKSGGTVCILEFSMPETFPVKQVYQFYFRRILPKIGRAISKDESAYSYLPASVEQFPKPKDFLRILANHGLINYKAQKLSFGIAMLYTATKA